MVVLVLLLQASEYGNRFGRARFVHHNLLETALEGLVLLEVLLVLVQGGGAYGSQFSPCEGRLQDVGGVHGTGTAAGTDQGVNLIDEEDDLTVAFDHFLYHSLQSLLELALILGSRDERAHVQGIYLPVLQVLRDLPVNNLAGNSFGDGCLTHTRFTYKNRVVLGPARKNLQDPSYLVVPAYHRVELSFCSELIEVHCILAQKFVILFHN